MKKNRIMGAFLFINLLALSGCERSLEIPVGAIQAETDGYVKSDIGQYEITNYDCLTSDEEAQEIDLGSLQEGESETYSYDGYRLTIFKAGDYRITGKMKGTVAVSVFEDETVHLILDNVDIKADRGAAVYVESAAKVILTAKAGTENVLSDGAEDEGEQKACVFAASDLTINGEGTLRVYGFYGDGVRSKDRLKAVNTTLYVKAKKDGLRGNDGVILVNSQTQAECEGTGILADSEKDMVVVQGGSCKVIAGKHAITANQYVSVRECQTDFYSVLETVKCGGIQDYGEERP